MRADAAALAYLASGVLFILALRGLSSPVTSRAGNLRGMAGMALAIVTTLWIARVTDSLTWALIAGGIAIGGSVGAVVARRIAMTHLPQLVAAFHSLVGLAAVLVAAAAMYSPEAYGIGREGLIRTQSLIEMSLGVAIGAITFAGSLIAFAKLNGNMSGAPILLPARHATCGRSVRCPATVVRYLVQEEARAMAVTASEARKMSRCAGAKRAPRRTRAGRRRSPRCAESTSRSAARSSSMRTAKTAP